MKCMDKKGRTRVIALLSSLCGASFIALMCSIFAWFIPNNQLDNTHISGSLLRGYFHEANFGTENNPIFSDGSKDHPYVITRPQHLYNLAHLQFEYVNVGDKKISFADQGYHFQIGWNLEGDDDLEVYSIDGKVSKEKVLNMNGMTLPPIGFIDKLATGDTASGGNYSFKGTFLGNGFNICNFTIAGSFSSGEKEYNPKNIGFFGDIAKHKFHNADCKCGQTNGAEQVSNFTLSNVTINTHEGNPKATQEDKENYVGYACGYIDEGKLSKVGVYNCRINCSSSYFRSNYTLIGEKNVSNSSFAEDAPILDYAFDPNGVVSGKSWWDTSKTSTGTPGTTCLSLDGKTYSELKDPTKNNSYDLSGKGISLNSTLYYNYNDSNNKVQKKLYNQFTSSDNVSDLLYDPRVFDIYGACKMSNYSLQADYTTTGKTKVISSFDASGNGTEDSSANNTPTDYNGNPIEVKLPKIDINNKEIKYGAIQVEKNSNSSPKLERKVMFKCDGIGKFLFIIIPNSSANNSNIEIFDYTNGIPSKPKYKIKFNSFSQGVPAAVEIPITQEGLYGFSSDVVQRIVYLRFMMQSEFGNTGGSGSVESVDYTYQTLDTYQTLEIPGSKGFTLSRITIRFDSTSSKNVIIVVTREKTDTSDEIKISGESKYEIGGTPKTFTIINKSPAGITINYPPTS